MCEYVLEYLKNVFLPLRQGGRGGREGKGDAQLVEGKGDEREMEKEGVMHN